MPECLKVFLQGLPLHLADEVWEYLDGNPDAVHEMIAIVYNIVEPQKVPKKGRK